MFTHDQHRKTGYRLQVIQNQLTEVAVNIRNSTPANSALYQNTLTLSPLYSLKPGPVTNLRRALDNEAHRENPNQGPLKLYCLNGQPDFNCPDFLPGVSEWMDTDYRSKKKERACFKGPGKQRLALSEIKAISIFLDFCGSEITNIGKEVLEHYGANHQGTKAALETVRAIQSLSFALAAIRPNEVTP